jgi:two-component system sensor histidine kinase/response regulator
MNDNTNLTETIPENLPGIDVQASTLRNRPALFLKGLKRFQESQQDFESNFNSARKNNDTEEATRLAHSLKGLAATFGAINLQQSALALEMACREKQADRIETSFKLVLENLQVVLAGIKKLN